MQITVRLVEDSEEGIRRKFVEEIEQCQCRDVYAIFEHINVSLFVEGNCVSMALRKGTTSRLLYHMEVHASTSYDFHATLSDSERSNHRIYLRS